MAIGTVERAYQLAPECKTLDELRTKLVEEGCPIVDAYLQGSLKRELGKLLNRLSKLAPDET